jgi:hypothetical protein
VRWQFEARRFYLIWGSFRAPRDNITLHRCPIVPFPCQWVQSLAAWEPHLRSQLPNQLPPVTPGHYPTLHAVLTFNKKVFAIPTQVLRSCLAPLLILGADVMFWHSYYYLVHQRRIEGDLSYTCTPKKFPTVAAVGWPWAPSLTPSTPGMQPTRTPPASLYDARLATTLVALSTPPGNPNVSFWGRFFPGIAVHVDGLTWHCWYVCLS